MNKIKPLVAKTFSYDTRQEIHSHVEGQQLDILILGGGITGAGCLRDASLRGLKCLLLETQDFAFGTSAYSSKFIHGGLRYLETCDFKLVWEGLKERAILLKTASDLVFSTPFIVPIYQKSRRPLWQVFTGCWLYYFLGKGSGLTRPLLLSSAEVEKWAPGISLNGLHGGMLYYDASTIDTSLVFANLQDAWLNNTPALNYTELQEIQFEAKEKCFHLKAHDKILKKDLILKARWILNATGPWSEFTQQQFQVTHQNYRLRPTKGTHLILNQALPQPKAVVVTEHPTDGRVSFIYPWMGKTLVGTTDTDFQQPPQQASSDEHDRNYLLSLYDSYFPNTGISHSNIVSEFSGVRPLVSPRSNKPFKPSDISREHVLDEPLPQFLSLQGGKLTSYRKMAQDALNYICKTSSTSPTRKRPLPTPHSFFLAQKPFQLEQALEEAYTKEMCLTAEDFFKRRTWLHYLNPQFTQENFERVNKYFQSKTQPRV